MKSTRKLKLLMTVLVIVCIMICILDIYAGVALADEMNTAVGVMVGAGGVLTTIIVTFLLYTVLEVFAELVRNSYTSSYLLSILVNDAHPSVPVLDDPETAAQADDYYSGYEDDEDDEDNEDNGDDGDNEDDGDDGDNEDDVFRNADGTAEEELLRLRQERSTVVNTLNVNKNLTAEQRQALVKHLTQINERISLLEKV